MKCPKCGYEWEPRKEHPKSCPECKTRIQKLVFPKLSDANLTVNLSTGTIVVEGLPEGLVFNQVDGSFSGTISGIPTQTGTFRLDMKFEEEPK